MILYVNKKKPTAIMNERFEKGQTYVAATIESPGMTAFVEKHLFDELLAELNLLKIKLSTELEK